MTDEEREELMKNIQKKVDRFNKLSPKEREEQVNPSAGRVKEVRTMGHFVYPPGRL
jgi:hypothetical protein